MTTGPFRIGHVTDKEDGGHVYFAFVPKDAKADTELQDLMTDGKPICSVQELDRLSSFHVEDKDPRKASRRVKEGLKMRGMALPFDPLTFWESRCPWLMN